MMAEAPPAGPEVVIVAVAESTIGVSVVVEGATGIVVPTTEF